MSNYLKKFNENTTFGTTELCRYCAPTHVSFTIILEVLYSIYVTGGMFVKNGTTSLSETNIHCYLSMKYLRNWWHLLSQRNFKFSGCLVQRSPASSYSSNIHWWLCWPLGHRNHFKPVARRKKLFHLPVQILPHSLTKQPNFFGFVFRSGWGRFPAPSFYRIDRSCCDVMGSWISVDIGRRSCSRMSKTFRDRRHLAGSFSRQRFNQSWRQLLAKQHKVQ